MQDTTAAWKQCRLFQGLTDTELEAVLGCVTHHRQRYEKQEILFRSGDVLAQAGIVLSGELHLFREDFWGNQTILADFRAGDLFGEAFACLSAEKTDVSARAVQQTEVLYLDMQRLFTSCGNACTFHTRLIHNFIGVLAAKNHMLNRKILHLTQRSTRAKLLSYLSEQSVRAGNASFQIPFNRQQLADYLSVERSAMSAELSRLRAEGILSYHKNSFTLLAPQEDAVF